MKTEDIVPRLQSDARYQQLSDKAKSALIRIIDTCHLGRHKFQVRPHIPYADPRNSHAFPCFLIYLGELFRSGWIEMDQRGALRPSPLMLEFAIRHNQRYVPQQLRWEVLKRDGWRCRYCGKSVDYPHIDHIIPYSRGGNHLPDNLAVSCPACNLKKGDRYPEEAGLTLIVPVNE